MLYFHILKTLAYLGFTHWNQQILNQFMPSELPVINSVSSKLDVKQMLLFSDQVSRKERVVGFFVDLLTFALFTLPGGGGKRGTPLYKPYKYVPLKRERFVLAVLVWKTGILFVYYGLKSGIIFKGTTRAYKRICPVNSNQNITQREVSKIYHFTAEFSVLMRRLTSGQKTDMDQ